MVGFKAIVAAFLVGVLAVGVFVVIELNERVRGPLSSGFRMAVIGGGLGGASVAAYTGIYFQRLGCGRRPHFDIYEKTDRWGGRLIAYDFDGALYNPMQLGGNWFPNTSLTMLQLLAVMGVKMVQAEYDNEATRIWNGKTFETPIPSNDPNFDRVRQAYRTFSERILRVYVFLAFNQFIYKSVWGFLNPTGEKGMFGSPFPFVTYEQHVKEYGVTPEFLAGRSVPNLRFIWSQNGSVNAFSGFIGDTLVDNHYRIDGGSSQLVPLLLNRIKDVSSQYLSTEVTDVTKLSNGRYEVKVRDVKTQKVRTEIYDAVALASPVEHANIKFHGLDFPTKTREWLALHMYLVDAKEMNPVYFGLDPSEKVPDSIKTTEGVNFTSIFPTSPTTHGTNVYMVFSYVELDIEKIFKDIRPYRPNQRWVHHFYPYVYQKLNPKTSPNDFMPYEVAPNFIYLNAMEDFVSGMELCLISTNNAGKYFADKNARPSIF